MSLKGKTYLKLDDYTIQFGAGVCEKGGSKHGGASIKCLMYILTCYRMGRTFISTRSDVTTNGELNESGLKKQEFLNEIFPDLEFIDGRYLIRLRVDEAFEFTGRSSNRAPSEKSDALEILGKVIYEGITEVEYRGKGMKLAAVRMSYIKDGYAYYLMDKDAMKIINECLEYSKCNLTNLYKLRSRYACMLYLFLGRYWDLFNTSKSIFIPKKEKVVYEKLGINPGSKDRTHYLREAVKEINEVLGVGLEVELINSEVTNSKKRVPRQIVFHVKNPEILKPEDK